MIDRAKIGKVLDRLSAVEAAMGDPLVVADAKRYRETVREHTFLRKLESAAKTYYKLAGDIEGNESLLEDPDFAEEARAEIERNCNANERAYRELTSRSRVRSFHCKSLSA